MAQNLQQQNFDFLIIEALSKGFQDVYNQSELLVKKEEANEVIQNYFKAKAGRLAIENLEAVKMKSDKLLNLYSLNYFLMAFFDLINRISYEQSHN